MDYFSPIEIWLIVGICCIIIEFSTIPGFGFLFLGLGALSASSLIYYYPNLVSYQLAVVGIASLIWFICLWWPLKSFIYKKNTKNQNFNLIGSSVTVVSEEIKASQMGKVSWSGTIMNAKLDDLEQEVKAGDVLYIKDVKGNVLICSSKMYHNG